MNIFRRHGKFQWRGLLPFKNSNFMTKTIIDSISDAILVVGQDRRIVLANPASSRLFGYSGEELNGQTTEMIYPDREAYEKVGKEHYASLQQGKCFLFESTFRRKDGGIFDAEMLSAVLHDLHGSPMWYVAMIRDITERKRLESELRQSEQQYRDLVSVIEARHIIYTHDVNGNFTYLSPSVTSILGYSREEFMTHYSEYMTDHPANAEAVRRTALSIRGEQQPAYEVQLFHKNGERRWLEVVETPLRGPDGTIMAVHGIGRDITDHKRGEEELLESETRFRKIFESAPIGMHMYEFRPDGRLVFICANPAADRILGVDNSAFIGKTIEEAFPPLKDTEIPDQYRETAARGTSWRSDNVDYENGLIRGAYEVVAFQTSPGIMVASFTEITERKKKEEELRRLNAELQEASAKVRILKGMLPICSYCKRIRDDDGKWEQLEWYITKRSQAEFSHSICPECMNKRYPNLVSPTSDRKDPDDRSKAGK
jgi:PAS domain S-box-containing protein